MRVSENGGVLKTCTKCNIPKDETEFYNTKSTSHGDSWCKSCKRADAKSWRQQNPERYRQQLKDWKRRNPNSNKEWREATSYHLKHTFGLTKEEWNAMFDRQGRCCAICKSTSPADVKNGRWHTDHDHATGEVRGILCGNCNLGLGNFLDDATLLTAAICYLNAKKWNAKVGETELSTTNPGSLRYEIVDPKGNVQDAFRNEAGAKQAVDDYNAFHRGTGKWTVRDNGTTEKVHSIEITPKMRNSVLHEGQPIAKNESVQSAAPLAQAA